MTVQFQLMSAPIMVDGYRFPCSNLDPSADQKIVKELSKVKTSERKLFKRLKKEKECPIGFANAVQSYLSSGAVKLVAMIEQAKKIPEDSRHTLVDYKSLAAELSLFQPIDEVAHTWKKLKQDKSSHRTLVGFGPMYRAAQHIVQRIISVVLKPRKYQFDIEKRGRDAAIKYITEKFEQGYQIACRLDVKDYYGSFTSSGLSALLPIPKDVVNTVIMPVSLKIKPLKGAKHTPPSSDVIHLHNHTLWSQSGLAQGSVCSPIVAAFHTARLKIDIVGDVVIVIYVDDIFIMAKNASTLEAAKHALLSVYGSSPSGNFKLKCPDENFSAGIDFLGYRLKVNTANELIIAPSPDAEGGFDDECSARIKRIDKLKKNNALPHVRRAALVELVVYIGCWTLAYKASTEFQELLKKALQRCVELCNKYDEFVTTIADEASFDLPYIIMKSATHSDGYVIIADVSPKALSKFLTDLCCLFGSKVYASQ